MPKDVLLPLYENSSLQYIWVKHFYFLFYLVMFARQSPKWFLLQD